MVQKNTNFRFKNFKQSSQNKNFENLAAGGKFSMIQELRQKSDLIRELEDKIDLYKNRESQLRETCDAWKNEVNITREEYEGKLFKKRQEHELVLENMGQEELRLNNKIKDLQYELQDLKENAKLRQEKKSPDNSRSGKLAKNIIENIIDDKLRNL